MNILLIGTPSNSLISAVQASQMPGKLFTASDESINDIPNIQYYSLENLAQKAKTLQIDIAINTDKSLIDQNIVEIFRENRVNLISVNKKWLNLETSRLATKKLMDFYSINNPKIIKAPMNFPVVLKTDSGDYSEVKNSMEELLQSAETMKDSKKFVEEYLDGEEFELLSLWDGKSLYCLNSPENTNEVKDDRLYLLKTKLSFMFSDEKADFTGLFTVRLIWAKNDWYVKDFSADINKESLFNNINKDFLYILNSAIYQKLNEI